MRIEVWGQTDVGLKRDNNQDTFLIDSENGLYIVADGMGGHRGGEVASALAVQTVREIVLETKNKNPSAHPRELLNYAYKEASKRIFNVSQMKEDLRGMGTTMVVSLFRDDTFFIANVGDSRVYLYSSPHGYWQLTEDHSLLYEHLRAGLLREKDIPHFVSRNIITRSVGFEPEVTPDIIERKMNVGEMLIMCSDGLSGLVSDERVAEICAKNSHTEIVPVLIREAKKNGGDDNVTAILLVAE